MNIKEVLDYMAARPYTMRMGARTVANRLHCDDNLVREARKILQNLRSGKSLRRIPRVLLFDLETAPMRAYVWSRWKQDISLEKTISESFIICWSAKWLYGSEVYSDACTPEEIVHGDDRRVCVELWKLINKADIVIAHNAKKADIPWMNSRFIIHGLLPNKPYAVVDTLEIAKKSFGFSSNKLDALAGYFGIEHKIDTSFELWRDCMEGNKAAIDYMVKYNKKDVEILEEVFLRLRPWAKGMPNISNIVQDDVCPLCGGEDYELLEGQYYYTSVGRYQLYRCKHCGGIFRDRFGDKEYKPMTIALR